MLDHDLGHSLLGRRIQPIVRTFWFWIFRKDVESSILTWVNKNTASPAHPGSLVITSITFATIIWDDTCSVNTAQNPESSFTMSPRSTIEPLYFWYWGSSSDFLRRHRSINDAKWIVWPALHASSITNFFLVSDFRQLPYWIFPFFLHYCFCIHYFSMLEASEWISAQNCMTQWFLSFCKMWSSWHFCGTLPNRILIESSASTTQANLFCVSQYRSGFLRGNVLVFCKALLLTSEFLTFCERFSCFPWILHHQVQ